MKRALSVFLTLAMLLSMFTVFFVTEVAAATIISNTSPAITANVGEKINLSDYSVTFDGDTSATSGVTWKNGSTAITTFTPDAKGVTELTASSGSKSKTIYVVAKNTNESEYVLYEANMADFANTAALTSAGWVIPSTSSMLDGDLIIDSASAFLPAWLGDFGDYAFSADIRVRSVTNSSRWFSLMYRAANREDVPAYLQMCVRNATNVENGVEFAEKYSDGTSALWNVAKKASGIHNVMGDKYRNVRVAVYGNTISQEIAGKQLIYVDDATYTSSVKQAPKKGYLGITMNGGTLRVKNVRITVQPSAPVQESSLVVNDKHNAENLINPIANVQDITSVSADMSNLSVAYFDLTSGINASDALGATLKANVVPVFYVENNTQADNVINASREYANNDISVISNSTSVISYVRMKNNYIRTGLAVDISEQMKDKILTDYEADKIRVTVRSAPATFMVIDSKYATKQAVSELQEMAVGVWVNVGSDADTAEFELEALTALTSGANGIISANAASVSGLISKYFVANTFTRLPITIGHRGNPSVATENTIASFEAAYNNGADVFEIDVHRTSDGVIVVNHDTTLNRTTNYTGTAKISEMTWEDIKQYHVYDIDGTTSTGKPIPSLAETLEWARGKDIKIFVEFKNSTEACIADTMTAIMNLGMTQQVDVISFNKGALTSTQSNIPGMSTGFLLGSTYACPDYATGVELFESLVGRAQDVNSTINPESYGNEITNLAVQAATDRGFTYWPYTFNATTTNTSFFDCPDGITTNNMELVKDMVKILHGSNFAMQLGETYEGGAIKTETYGNTITSIKADELTPYVIGGDSVEVKDGKLVAVKDGFASVMFGYKTATYNGDEYVVYTQPITVRVGGTVDANGEKVVYIPLDDRPINKERLEYMAKAAGFELIMPDVADYSTRIDFYNEGASDQGNPEKIYEWLKTVDDAKYYVISLDQILSGGLVGSRAPFSDTDDTIASDISSYDWTTGGYELSEKEQEVIDYLIELSNRTDTHVVFFDTVMRLASTGDYFNYRGSDYSNFRNYGMLERKQLSGDDLTISNIVTGYNYDTNGAMIAENHKLATHGEVPEQYKTVDKDNQECKVFTYTNSSGQSVKGYLDWYEFKEYVASRERKLVIADALYPNIVNSAARLYIGFDDSNPKITIQSNEGRYITEKLISGADNCHLFSGADELGMMGLADVATSIYGEITMNPIYFGGGKDLPADEYDTGILSENVDVHIEGIGGTASDTGELELLILTRTDGGDGYNSTELTALNTAAAELVARAKNNLDAGVPTCIIDCSDRDGVLSAAILASDIKNRIGELMGYSQWNTIANSLGTAICNATSRYTYLKNSIVITEESNKGFMEVVTAAWIKDVVYQQYGKKPHTSSAYFADAGTYYNTMLDYAESVMTNINNSPIAISVVDGRTATVDKWNATVSNFRWPWDRGFEALFDISVGSNLQYKTTPNYDDRKVSNLTQGNSYEVSLTPNETYPDSGKELTDGKVVSDSDIFSPGYKDERWVGFTATSTIRNVDIVIPLGDGETLYDVYQFKVNVGTDKLGAGIIYPNLEIQVSEDGVNFKKVRYSASSTDTTNYSSTVYLGAPFESVKATHIKVILTPRERNLMWISEIAAFGVASEASADDIKPLSIGSYFTDETKKWWPDWNTPPCDEGATYDDKLRLVDGEKDIIGFGKKISGWYPTNNVQMTFNLSATSTVNEVIAYYSQYHNYIVPTACKVEVSTDGVNFIEVEADFSSVETIAKGEVSEIWSTHECYVKLKTPAKAKQVRLTFSTASNNLFLFSEVEIYGTGPDNIVFDKPYELSGKPVDRYTGANFALTDGTKHTYTVYNNTVWLWSAANTTDNKGTVIFQLDKTYDLVGASAHINVVTKSGIKSPAAITVYTSSDGKNYTKLGDATIPVYGEDNIEVLWAEVVEEAKCVNFVMVEFTRESGFIMLDEIEVYGAASATEGIHSASNEWSADKDNHWHDCDCGEKLHLSAHDEGVWITTEEAGIDKEGKKELRCTVCEYVMDTDTIPMEHKYSEDWKTDETNHWHECGCGDKTDVGAHDNGKWVTTEEAGLDKEGKKELRCTVCEYVMDTDTIPMEHEYSEDWKTDKDNHWHECGCGEKTDVGTHDNGKWVTTEEAGLHKEGKKELRCTVCGYVLDTDTIPAEHSYSKDWKSDKTNHWHECSCGDKVDNAKHDSGKWVTTEKAGVDKEGKKELRCTVCGYVLDTETIPMKHDFSKDWKSDESNHWHECACGEKTDVAVHDEGAWHTTKEAEIGKEGEKALICTVCGYVIRTATIPALEDKPVDDKFMLGDINESGEIDSMDYILLKRNYFGTYKFTERQFKIGDINKNGEIDSMDYILLKRAYFGTYTIQ